MSHESDRIIIRRVAIASTLFVLLFYAPVLTQDNIDKISYPAAHTGDAFDLYHGVKIPDPYRWLEDADSDETVAWVAAQNKLTADFVNTPVREKIKNRYISLLNYVRYTTPKKKGGRYFFKKNDGLQDHAVLYMQESLDAEPVIVLDPNTLSEDGTVAVMSTSFSHDASLLAYGISQSGSDRTGLRIRNIETGEEYPETIKWLRGGDAAWKHDNSGFFYDRYPHPDSIAPEDRTYYNRVYWHTLGTEQSEDILVYERPDDKTLGFAPEMTDDGKYLVLYVWHGTDRENRFYYREVDSDGEFVRLLDKADAGYRFINNIGTVFYFRTDLDAPRGRIIAVDISHPESENWREILPEQNDVIHRVKIIGGHLVISFMHDAYNRLLLYDLNGAFIKEINFPTIGSLYGLSGQCEDTELFVSFSSYLYPATIFRYDFESNELNLFYTPDIDFDPSLYISRQVFYKSKDGTKIPMFLTYKKDIPLDANNPTILYGYGGFQVSQTPYFSNARTIWLENGGVYAVACLRGGGEYGEEWHQAGMLEKKQNVYDDFIAAAEWLIDNEFTCSSRLAIEGGSNGGLLVAACMVQRPDLFGAVNCAVPLTDMLRYHKLGCGHWWIGEYGNAEANPEHFEFIRAWSPYHNIIKGVTYPATLISSADTDDRVVPSHAKKFAAALQAADSGKNPILLRIETKAGHGGGKPTNKVIEEVADEYAFLFRVFGMQPVK